MTGPNTPKDLSPTALFRAAGVLFVVLAFLIPELQHAQTSAPAVAWQERLGGPADDLANAVATDEAGNAYVVGRFTGSLDGQPSTGQGDAFLRVYSPAGEVLLSRQFGSTAFDEATDVAVVGTEVYVVGRTFGSTAPGLPSGRRMGFVHRYSIDVETGAFVRTFAAQLGRDDGQSDVELYSIAVAADGAMYVAGVSNGAVHGSTIAGNFDAVIARYDASGALAWVKTVGMADRDEGRSVTVGADGSAYLVGSVMGALPGQTASGFVDAFVRKYDATGGVIWTRQFGTSSYDDATGVLAMSEHVYVVGTTGGLLGAGVIGGLDVYWRKLDESGTIIQTAQFGSIGNDFNAAIAPGPDGSYAVSAEVRVGESALFVSLWKPTGGGWGQSIAGPLPARVQFGHNVAISPSGAIILCGALDGGFDGVSTFNWDAFVVGLAAPAPPEPNAPPTVDAGGPYVVNEGSRIVMTATGVDSDGDSLTYEWDLDGSGSFESQGASVFFDAHRLDESVHLVRVRAVDPDGLVATAETSVTVLNVAPTIAFVVPQTAVVNEGADAWVFVSYDDPGLLDWNSITVDWGDGSAAYRVTMAPGSAVPSPVPHHVYSDNGSYRVIATVQDPSGATAVGQTTIDVTNVAPVISGLRGPMEPMPLGASTSLSLDFSDPGADMHAVEIDWDDGSPPETLALPVGARSATIERTYAQGGVYTVSVTVRDDDAGSSTTSFAIVIFDLDGGEVVGAGTIVSPPGAYIPDPTIAGDAHFVFRSRYERGRTVPNGRTQFRFQTGNVIFVSDTYEWLVVAGRRAMFQGTGSLNGQPGYRFFIIARDDDPDGFRIRIFQSFEWPIYDNVRGSSTDMDDSGLQQLSAGAIVVRQ
jgi:hypothetical protein